MNDRLTVPAEAGRDRWPLLHAIAAVALLLYYMLFPVAPLHGLELYATYGKLLIAAVTAVYFYRRGFRGCVELGLVTVFVLWVLISRLLNGDFYLRYDVETVYGAAVLLIAFSAGLLLDAAGRAKLLNWVSALFCGFYTLLAAAGIFVFLTYTYIHLPPENAWITINDYYGGGSLVALQLLYHRNIASAWLYVALFLLIYQFFNCQSRLWRIPITLSALIDFVALGLCRCRTVQVAAAISLAMLAMLLVLKYVHPRKKLAYVPLLALTLAGVTVLGYKGFDLAAQGVSSLSRLTAPAFIQTYMASDDQLDPEYFGIILEVAEQYENRSDAGENGAGETGAEETFGYSDDRDFLSDASTMTGRSSIWRTVIPAVQQRPQTLLSGQLSRDVLTVPLQYMPGIMHMHSSPIQTLLLTGLPGLLLAASVMALLILRLIRVFFSARPQLSLPVKLLTVPLTGLMVYSMMESFLFTSSDARSFIFFLLAGAVLGYYYDAYPKTKKQ